MLPIQPHTIRSPKLAWWIITVMILIYGGYLIEQGEIKRSDYAVVFCGLFLLTYFAISFKRVLIYIDNDGILGQKIFSKTFIEWKEITAADIVMEGASKGVSVNWILERTGKEPYRIYLLHTERRAVLQNGTLWGAGAL